jgi:chemotaxis protein MotB
MIRKRVQDIPSSNSMPWMTTYADMVTLLLCFFILLFSMSSVQRQKFDSALGSIQGAIGVLDGAQPSIFTPEHGSMTTTEGNMSLIARELAQLETMGKDFQRELELKGMGGKVSIGLEERGLVLRFADSVLFDVGSAELRNEAVEVVMAIGDLLKTVNNQIRVEGHTDNWPIDTLQFPSNWELSTGRATKVVRFLEETCAIPSNQLQAAGYGSHRPIASNDTAEGRQKNRRIDVIILRSSLSRLEPNSSNTQ